MRARSVLSHLAVGKMGMKTTQVVEWLNLSEPVVSKSLLRGGITVKENPLLVEVFQ